MQGMISHTQISILHMHMVFQTFNNHLLMYDSDSPYCQTFSYLGIIDGDNIQNSTKFLSHALILK